MYSPLRAAVLFSRLLREGVPHEPTDPIEKAAIVVRRSLEPSSDRQSFTFSPAAWLVKSSFLRGNKEAEGIAREALMERMRIIDWSVEVDAPKCLDLNSYRTRLLPAKCVIRRSRTPGLFGEPVALVMKGDWVGAISEDELNGSPRDLFAEASRPIQPSLFVPTSAPAYC